MVNIHRQRLEKLEGELAMVQSQLHNSRAMTEQASAQHRDASARCNEAESNLKLAEEALSKLEIEHRKFVEQATALCNQKDAAIAVCQLDIKLHEETTTGKEKGFYTGYLQELTEHLNVEKQVSCSQAALNDEKHTARMKELESEVENQKGNTAAAEKQVNAVQAELLSCKGLHQKEAAESKQQLLACQKELDDCRREVLFVCSSQLYGKALQRCLLNLSLCARHFCDTRFLTEISCVASVCS